MNFNQIYYLPLIHDNTHNEDHKHAHRGLQLAHLASN